MVDNKRFVYNAECHVVDLGYAILMNGDIVTSDGEPRDIDQVELRLACEMAAAKGMPITEFRFRKVRDDDGEI